MSVEKFLDSLYVIGGHDGTQSLNSVEILDHPNGQWRLGPSLNTPRANTHSVVTAGNVIYVIGGFDGVQFLSSIELLESGRIFLALFSKPLPSWLFLMEADENHKNRGVNTFYLSFKIFLEAAGWRNWQQTRSTNGSVSDGTIPEDDEEDIKSISSTERSSSEPFTDTTNNLDS